MTGKPDFSKHMVNLASQRLGAKVQEVSDDFFAEAKRMLQDSEPTFSRIFTMNMENGWMAGKAEGDANRGMIMRWSNLGQEGLFMVWTSTPVTSQATTPHKHRWKGWIAVLLQTRFPEIGKNCFQSQNLALTTNIFSPLKTAAH